MKFSNESDFNRWWSNCFTKCKAMVLPIVGNEMQPAGWPDRLVIHSVWKGFIEGKRFGCWLTDLQDDRCVGLNSRGFNALVFVYYPKNEVKGFTVHDAITRNVLEVITWEEVDAVKREYEHKTGLRTMGAADGKIGRMILDRLPRPADAMSRTLHDEVVRLMQRALNSSNEDTRKLGERIDQLMVRAG